MTLRTAVTGFVGVVFAGLNLAYWWFVVARGLERFRRYCERRYAVSIGAGPRGHWKVSGGPWWRRVAIQWLQLAYFLGAFFVWAMLMLLGFGALQLAEVEVG